MKASWTASSARSKSPSDADQRRDRASLLLAEDAVDDVAGGVRSGQERRSRWTRPRPRSVPGRRRDGSSIPAIL